MNRLLLLLQAATLALLGVCLHRIGRIEAWLASLPARTGGPSGAGASPEDGPSRDPAALLGELRAAADRFLSNPQDPIEQRIAEKRMDAAVEALKRLGAAGFEPLASALDSAGPATFRRRVLEAMEGIDPARTADHAIRIFRAAGEPLLRMAAGRVAMRTAPDRALPELLALIRRESEASFPVLGEAVGLAAESGGPEAVRAILELAGDPARGKSSAYRAIEALGALRAPEAVDLLRRHVVSEPQDGLIRMKSVQALAKIEGKAVLPFLEDRAREERQETFRKFLENTIEEVRAK